MRHRLVGQVIFAVDFRATFAASGKSPMRSPAPVCTDKSACGTGCSGSLKEHQQIRNNQTISIVVSAFNKPESTHQVPASEYAEVLNDRQRTASTSDAFYGIRIPVDGSLLQYFLCLLARDQFHKCWVETQVTSESAILLATRKRGVLPITTNSLSTPYVELTCAIYGLREEPVQNENAELSLLKDANAQNERTLTFIDTLYLIILYL
jgi:hypothetical protein